ncbi:MAG: aminoacyl-tRNA hydrolase [Planctomycetota bacterium]|nr:MAG: aminoacyl-tRNA hydrolase [Planctomycetota bacterium]
MKLIVGLGNPGRQYAGTRHNVGFDVLQVLGQRLGVDRWKSQFEADVADGRIGDERVLLLAPTTYMNLSGRAVKSHLVFHKATAADVLVICDDLNLPSGKLRIRGSGTAGGQKGLQNIVDQLGTTQVPRLRIGIGRPSAPIDPSDYVLGRFSAEERSGIDTACKSAADAVELWVKQGLAVAMNKFNIGDFEGPAKKSPPQSTPDPPPT